MAFLQDKRRAALIAVAAVGVASTQDAIVKLLSSDMPASQAVAYRAGVALAVLLPWCLLQAGMRSLWPSNAGLVILRGLLMCAAYFAFILSIAVMPIATSVSIYFTMPFFVAALAGWTLGERVQAYRWIAITAGFTGVLIMVRPGSESFEPAALLALLCALFYAVGQLLSRHTSQVAHPLAIAAWQSIIYGAVALGLAEAAPFFAESADEGLLLGFLLRPWIMPTSLQLVLLLLMGLCAMAGSLLFVHAYRLADANYVAPFEYTALLWAMLFGVSLFGDIPDIFTVLGAAIVIGAGLWMLQKDFSVTRSESRSTP